MAIIKCRHIRFKKAPSGRSERLEELIRQVNGVLKARVDVDRKEVYVEYDLLKCCQEAIEHWMEKNGFSLDESFLERFKRGWIHYTEENERDALESEAHSCCDVEGIEKKRKDVK